MLTISLVMLKPQPSLPQRPITFRTSCYATSSSGRSDRRDRGRQFVADVVEELLRRSASQFRHATSYHPQTNGLTERVNRTLVNMLAMFVDSKHKNWDAILPFMTYAYNTALHETTGFSPFYLLYIRPPRTTLDAILPFRIRQSHLLQRHSVTQRRQGASHVSGLSHPKTVRRPATISDIDMSRTVKEIWCGCGLHNASVACIKSFWPATQVPSSFCRALATLRTSSNGSHQPAVAPEELTSCMSPV